VSSRSIVVLALAAAVVGAAGAPAAAAPAAPAEPVAAPAASAEVAVPGLSPAGASTSAVYLDKQGRAVSRAGGIPYAERTARSGGVRPALGCTPVSGRDDPHYSLGDVSGHGWWDKGTCSASTAHVYNCLYEYYTDNTWRQKACSSRLQLRPGGGSGNRTTARARCNPTSGWISWRNHVDVDVDGQIDTGEQPYNQANVVCVVF